MPFVSYAQNAEDVPLWRLFHRKTDGFYIDVGASGPHESITTAFYNHGWTGLNLEPAPHLFEIVRDARPRDINLQLAASDKEGLATLYTDPDANLGGLSTLHPDKSEKGKVVGFAGTPVPVPTETLAAVCEKHAHKPIDFLKIDVEGHERAVIAGADWTRWRPRVVVVEATEPMSSVPSHHDWEPLLLAADYKFGLFDGLNRFYVRAEDEGELLWLLSYPACIFDGFIPARHAADIERLQSEYAALQVDRDAVWWQLHHMRLRAEAAEAELAKLRMQPPERSSPTR